MDQIMEILMQQDFVKQLAQQFNLDETEVVSKLQAAGPELMGIFSDGKVDAQELMDVATKLFSGNESSAGGILDTIKGFIGQ